MAISIADQHVSDRFPHRAHGARRFVAVAAVVLAIGAFVIVALTFLVLVMWSYLFASIMPRPWDQRSTPLPPLHAAAASGDIETVKVLLASGEGIDRSANSNDQWPDGTTALMIAAVNGNAELTALLLDSGATLDLRLEQSGTSAIHIAAPGALEILLAHGADINARTQHGQTPLMTAAVRARSSHDRRAIEVLLAAGADVNARDAQGRTVLDILRTWPDTDSTLMQLIEDAGGR